jgi:hypothetical protein
MEPPVKRETESPVTQESVLSAQAENGVRAARRPQSGDAWQGIAKLETGLSSAADNLRANSKLTSSDYFMPVLGLILLRYAQKLLDACTKCSGASSAGPTRRCATSGTCGRNGCKRCWPRTRDACVTSSASASQAWKATARPNVLRDANSRAPESAAEQRRCCCRIL